MAVIENATLFGYELPAKSPKTHLWLSRMRKQVSVRAERLSAEK